MTRICFKGGLVPYFPLLLLSLPFSLPSLKNTQDKSIYSLSFLSSLKNIKGKFVYSLSFLLFPFSPSLRSTPLSVLISLEKKYIVE
jgi:hypothetical protein